MSDKARALMKLARECGAIGGTELVMDAASIVAYTDAVRASSLPQDDVMRQALEALERAKNGLEWYWDLFPTTLSHADGEMAEQIDAAITSLRAAISADPRPDQARVSLPPPLDKI